MKSEDKKKWQPLIKFKSRNNYRWKCEIVEMFESIYSKVMSNIQKSSGKSSRWIIDSPIDRTISISKFNLLAGTSYIK